MDDKLGIAWKFLRSRFVTHSPVFVTHVTTSMCNCRCKNCSLWKSSGEHVKDMAAADVFRMLDDAADAGMAGYVAWGGEPLMRKDLPEILEYAKGKGLATTVITNGYFLKERAGSIMPFTDYLIVSVDATDELHDELRGVKGILRRALDGMAEAKKFPKAKIMINTVINRHNLGEVEKLAELARSSGVLLTFEPMDVIAGYNEEHAASAEELKACFSRIAGLKKAGYPIVNSYQYLRNLSGRKAYTCHMAKVYITVNHDGEVATCLYGDVSSGKGGRWGNIKDRPFKEIFGSREYRDMLKASEGCNRCGHNCVIETSLLYSLDVPSLLEKIRLLA